MSDEQLDAAPNPGKWSTRQVVCHIADFEPVYADRMKRVIAISEPTFCGGDIVVSILHVAGNRVRLGIDAPKKVRIVRGELERFADVPQYDFARNHNQQEGRS